jgi:hypothetical protein
VTDIVVNQNNIFTLNYKLPYNLTSKTVLFRYGNLDDYSKEIKCERQPAVQGSTSLANGGVAINFKQGDLDRHGTFFVQFIIEDQKTRITYPEKGYITMEVQKEV